MRVFLVSLVALVTALAVLSPATAGASQYPTNADIRQQLKRTCDIAYSIATDAGPRDVVQGCNRYYKCLVRHLGYKKIRRMYNGIRAQQENYPFKPFNEACLETHIPR